MKPRLPHNTYDTIISSVAFKYRPCEFWRVLHWFLLTRAYFPTLFGRRFWCLMKPMLNFFPSRRSLSQSVNQVKSCVESLRESLTCRCHLSVVVKSAAAQLGAGGRRRKRWWTNDGDGVSARSPAQERPRNTKVDQHHQHGCAKQFLDLLITFVSLCVRTTWKQFVLASVQQKNCWSRCLIWCVYSLTPRMC